MGIVMKFIVSFSLFARSAALTAASLLMTGLTATNASANDGLYSVQLNKTEILRLPAAAGAVIIGNPDIADVTIHAADTLLVVGKGYGETNLIVMDKQGNTMMNSDIQVITPQSKNQVRVFNANSRMTYNCGPSCNPSPTLGDSDQFVSDNTASGGGGLSENIFAAASGSGGTQTSAGSSTPLNPPN